MIVGVVALLVFGLFAFMIWSIVGAGLRRVGDEQVDTAQTARSAAIAIGLLLSMLAVSVGLINLAQAGVSQRVAGSNSDLASAMSLLIVAGPIFGLLIWLTERSYASRSAAGDSGPQRGWSIYLVTALTITLLGVLVSIAQILDDMYSRHGIEALEVAQLLGWLLVWAAHWFVLRPRYRVRGSVHLAIGSWMGLAWLVTGVGGFAIGILSDAYDTQFIDVLTESSPIAPYAWAAVVGAVVWAWHWLRLRNGTTIEGHAQNTPLWYATVVGTAIVPSVIALLSVIGVSISGVAIWFIGTTDQSAVDYFHPSPTILTVGLIAAAVWAYHRWELVRYGPVSRNESIRFHDYVVAAIGLVGAVSGTAAIISLLITTMADTSRIAGSLETDNLLISSVVLLALSATVWWATWSRIDTHRHAEPLAECESTWRRLYLILVAGFGGIVLAVSLIWVVFTSLNDLFEATFDRETLNDLAGPTGWSIAVVGAVWFHIGVWQNDRAVQATHAPDAGLVAPSTQPPSTQPPSTQPRSNHAVGPATAEAAGEIQIRWSRPGDQGEVFTLGRASFVDEAMTYNTPLVPALLETQDEFGDRHQVSHTLLAVDGPRIVGSVSVRHYRDGIPDIERLMVAPDRRGEGIANQLLTAIETWLQTEAHHAVQLIVGERRTAVRALCERRGYELVDRTQEPDGPALLTVRKPLG